MAITDAYETAANYRAVVDKDDDADDTEIHTDLLAVSRYIDSELGRFFTRDATAVARNYYPTYAGVVNPEAENPWRNVRGTRTLYIDDAVSVTSVVSDEDGDGIVESTWTVTTDYLLYPLNAALGPEPRPYSALFVPQTSTKFRWPPGRLVTVTGVWGWPSVPEPIKRATVHLAAILRLETPRAKREVSSMGEILGTSPQAQSIVDRLMKNYGRISV